MRFSVLSALAQLEVDPWQEAAKLAGLRGATATERLAALIALLPNEPSMHRDPETMRSRDDRYSLGRAPAAPRQFQYRSAQDVDRRRESEPFLGCHIHDFDGPRVGYGMDRG